MIFKTKEIQSTTFGERLQKARKEKRIRLVEAARKLGTRASYLEALENGEYKRLPPRVYAQGLMRKYVHMLGLQEGEELCRQFVAEYEASVTERDPPVLKQQPFLRRKRFTLTPKRLTALFSFLVLVIVASYLGYQVQQFVGKPNLIIIEPERDMFTDAASIVIKGKTDQNTKVSINGKDVTLAQDATFNAEVALKDGLNIIEIISSTRFGKDTKEIRRIIKHNP